MCWQLDPTEGPGRVRRRMMRAPLTIPNKHILSNTSRKSKGGVEEMERGQSSCENKTILHGYLQD